MASNENPSNGFKEQESLHPKLAHKPIIEGAAHSQKMDQNPINDETSLKKIGSDISTQSGVTSNAQVWHQTSVTCGLTSEHAGEGRPVINDDRTVLMVPTLEGSPTTDSFAVEQQKDPRVRQIFNFVERGVLPTEDAKAWKIALKESLYTIVDGILYYVNSWSRKHKRAVVPKHLQTLLLRDTHSSLYGGHFSGPRLFKALVNNWWWEGMFKDSIAFAKACPESAISTGVGRITKPPLQPIPVSRPFQILGIDIMDLPLTERGNRHVVVILDLFTKWQFIFAVPDQKTTCIAKLIAEEVVPSFGVPECCCQIGALTYFLI